MFYTYVLQSEKEASFYIGSTKDLKKRFAEHNSGLNTSTKYKKPWKLVYYEAYQTLSLARRREMQLKRYAKSFSMLKKRIEL